MQISYREEKHTQDNELLITHGVVGGSLLIDITVPSKATMKLLSIGTYSNITEPVENLDNMNWLLFQDGTPLPTLAFPQGRINGSIGGGYGRLRNSVEDIVIQGGHTFQIYAQNLNLVDHIMGVSIEYVFVWEEFEEEPKAVVIGGGSWLRKIESFLKGAL